MTDRVFTIKPLRWERKVARGTIPGTERIEHIAKTPFAEYVVTRERDEDDDKQRYVVELAFTFDDGFHFHDAGRHPSVAAAKAAATQHWFDAISRALIAVRLRRQRSK